MAPRLDACEHVGACGVTSVRVSGLRRNLAALRGMRLGIKVKIFAVISCCIPENRADKVTGTVFTGPHGTVQGDKKKL